MHLLGCKGQSLRYSPGWDYPLGCVVALYVGRDPRGNNAAYSALGWFSVTSATTHKQIGPFWCWFLGGWVCVHYRTLWASPMNSPVRLGVSPAAASMPTVFTARGFEALVSRTGTLGCMVCVTPQLFLPVYLHTTVGPPSLPAAALLHILSILAACLCPSYQSEFMLVL